MQTRSSAIAETACVTVKSVIATDRLTLTTILNITYVSFISLTELTIHSILYPVMLHQLTHLTVSEANLTNNV